MSPPVRAPTTDFAFPQGTKGLSEDNLMGYPQPNRAEADFTANMITGTWLPPWFPTIQRSTPKVKPAIRRRPVLTRRSRAHPWRAARLVPRQRRPCRRERTTSRCLSRFNLDAPNNGNLVDAIIRVDGKNSPLTTNSVNLEDTPSASQFSLDEGGNSTWPTTSSLLRMLDTSSTVSLKYAALWSKVDVATVITLPSREPVSPCWQEVSWQLTFMDTSQTDAQDSNALPLDLHSDAPRWHGARVSDGNGIQIRTFRIVTLSCDHHIIEQKSTLKLVATLANEWSHHQPAGCTLISIVCLTSWHHQEVTCRRLMRKIALVSSQSELRCVPRHRDACVRWRRLVFSHNDDTIEIHTFMTVTLLWSPCSGTEDCPRRQTFHVWNFHHANKPVPKPFSASQPNASFPSVPTTTTTHKMRSTTMTLKKNPATQATRISTSGSW